MAFYRHFVDRDDFIIRVATNRMPPDPESVPYEIDSFTNSAVMERLCRTRLLPWASGLQMIGIGDSGAPKAVRKIAADFKPDAVFTIAGTWDWSALVAEKVARELNVPLIASFNDWFNFGWFPPHSLLHGPIEMRFRKFYRDADLSLCTSEGMREELGPHRNAHVLYPIGAPILPDKAPFKPFLSGKRKFIVAFAGSMGGWYGEMLESLVRAAWNTAAPIEFRFYGSNCSWGQKFDTQARDAGIFRGHVPFDKLQELMSEADALILPMGFSKESALVERTSFKTKFLDYLTYRRPIIVWGPNYCSAVRAAREFDSAEVCTDRDANAALETIRLVADDPDRQAGLVSNANSMYNARFNPEVIHREFVDKVNTLVDNWPAK